MPRGRPRKIKDAIKETENKFLISLKIGNEVYKSSGATSLDALNALPIPPKLFLKGILTLTVNGKTKDFLMMPPKLKRLFFPLARKILAKQLDFIMK